MIIFENNYCYLNFWHDYQFSKIKYNWIEFNFINLNIEFNQISKNNKIHVAFLGFHLFFNWGLSNE
jgi:hypothetical protein